MYEKYVQAFLFVLVAGGIVTDMITAGVSNSSKAMTYKKPKELNKMGEIADFSDHQGTID